jgi:hypothetical protein
VYEDFNGSKEILLPAREGFLFSGPQAVDDERIVFVVSHNGSRELWLYNYITRELFRIENISGDNGYWLHMRGLRMSDGKLFFAHNADDRMYKLGFIDLDSMQAVFSERDFSGGVFSPVSVNDNVYYLGAFVSRDTLLRFPESVGSLSGNQYDIQLVRLDNLYNTTETQTVVIDNTEWAVRRYNSLRYMNPFQFWYPMPLFRESENSFLNTSFDGGGIISYIADPADRNFMFIEAYADIPYRMALIKLTWRNTTLGFPLTVNFSDEVIESINSTYRETTGRLSGSFSWSKGQWFYGFSLGGGYSRFALYTSGKNAYEWEESSNAFFVSSGLSLSNRPLSLQLTGISIVPGFQPRFDGVFTARANTRFPMHLTFFGAYDQRGMDLHGISKSYSGSLAVQYTLREYARLAGLELDWLAGAEAGIGLFSFQIQRNLSHLYFNHFSGILTVRNQLFDGEDNPYVKGLAVNDLHLIQSLMLRLSLKMSFFPVVKHPASFEPYVLGAFKFSNAITGEGPLWYYRVGFNLSL